MIEVWDKDGNKFYLAGGEGSTIHLQDEQGVIHEVPAGKLTEQYTGCPPDVREALERLWKMIQDGDITMDEIRKLRDSKSTTESPD